MSLYLIGTPIGNMKDFTFRAVEVLKSCSIVLVEKWSDSVKLLKAYDITPDKIMNYDDRNHRRAAPGILQILKDGTDAALITSAGMPGVSDPGAFLVQVCREAGIDVLPIPGASALSTAISVSGFTGDFLFVGFLPKKKGQLEKVFREASDNKHNLVFFESTYRLAKTVGVLNELFPECRVMVGKEMTKMFEQYPVLTPAEVLARIQTDKNFSRGEFTLIVNFSS